MTQPSARRTLCIAACLSLIGCAGPTRFMTAGQDAGTIQTPTGQSVGLDAALHLIAVGKSTKIDVATTLGQAIVIPFDSGFEVWVYRWPRPTLPNRSPAELVVLFTPSGKVAKVRIRPEVITLDERIAGGGPASVAAFMFPTCHVDPTALYPGEAGLTQQLRRPAGTGNKDSLFLVGHQLSFRACRCRNHQSILLAWSA